jgi:YD repeat-containing protein
MQILDTIAGRYRSVWGIYDGAGRMLQTQVDAGDKLLVNTTLFNAQGLASQQSLPYEVVEAGGNYIYDPGKQFTTTQYDALGRAISVTAPGQITTQTSYDGLTTTVLDPNGNKISRTTDGLGRMTSVAEFSDLNTIYATTTYFYDAADRLIRVKDAKLTTTTIQYDWLGRKLGMDDPDMGVWSYEYDALGNMSSQTDARVQQLTFTYDALNRLLTKSDGDTNTIDPVYTYGTEPGTIGLRVGMTDASGSTAWSYSNYGRTVTETRTIGGEAHSLTTEADWLSRSLTTTYDDGEVLSYDYDDLGRPYQLKSDETGQSQKTLVDLVYNILGQISTQTLGN